MTMVIMTRQMIQDPQLMDELFNDIPSSLIIYTEDPKIWLGGKAEELPQWMFVNGEPVRRPGVLNNTIG